GSSREARPCRRDPERGAKTDLAPRPCLNLREQIERELEALAEVCHDLPSRTCVDTRSTRHSERVDVLALVECAFHRQRAVTQQKAEHADLKSILAVNDSRKDALPILPTQEFGLIGVHHIGIERENV